MLIDILQADFHFEDDRGALTQLIHNGYRQINVIISKKGVQRGSHYHHLNKEAFYVVSGQTELIARKAGEIERRVFGPGAFFGIKSDISHDFSFLEDTVLVSMYDRGVELSDGTKDIITY